MKTPATLTFLLLFALLNIVSEAEAAPGDSIGHERLAAAYTHILIASDLARGTAQPSSVYAKAAKAMTNSRLRKEIGMRADRFFTDYPKTPKLERLDVAAHLHMARLKLTSDRNTTIEKIRESQIGRAHV